MTGLLIISIHESDIIVKEMMKFLVDSTVYNSVAAKKSKCYQVDKNGFLKKKHKILPISYA